MNSQPSYYTESGKVSPSYLVLAILVAIVISMLLGYVYSAATIHIPLIYANVLILLGVSILLGYVALALCKLSRVRNDTVRYVFVLSMGIIVWYVQWSVFAYFYITGELPGLVELGNNLSWAFYGSEQWDALYYYYVEGGFEVGRVHIFELALLPIWIIEFVILLGAPFYWATKYVPQPYSEDYEQWYEKRTLLKEFRVITDSHLTLEKLHTDAVSFLDSLQSTSRAAHAKVHVYHMPRERQQYLLVETVTFEGKDNSRKATPLVHNIAVSNEQARLLIERFDNEKAGFSLF